LKILFLQDHLETGGAARAAGRYAVALERLGHQVLVAAGDSQRGAEDFVVTGKPARGWKRIMEYLLSSAWARHRRILRARRKWRKVLEGVSPDLVWIHNLHGAFKWGWGESLVEEALAHARVFWTLHDMWPLGSGDFYFPEEALPRKFPCSPLARISAESANHPLVLTTPSHWLHRLVMGRNGPWSSLRFPYYMDTDVFQPAYREQMRRHLGLKPGEMLFLVVAENLEDPRKGLDLLGRAWTGMGDWAWRQNVQLGLVGRNGGRFARPDSRILNYGSQESEVDVASFMAAADLFVHPASADNFPLVMEEAQSCGTPVMAFDVGGVKETFQAGETGFLLPQREAGCLQSFLKKITTQERQVLAKMRTTARQLMLVKHGTNHFETEWAKVEETVGKIRTNNLS